MEELKRHFIFILHIVLALLFLANAQNPDQSAFISLDCGLPANSSYAEKLTKINYVSDDGFISTGVSKTISIEYRANFQQQMTHLRSFPEGIRNCYSIKVAKGTKYLIATYFLYGNYDGLNSLPKFDLHLDGNVWSTVNVTSASESFGSEIIHTPQRDYVHLCLVNTGSGTPFIQAIELRPLKNTTYVIPDTSALATISRYDLGSTTNTTWRYPYDAYDRAWPPGFNAAWTDLSTDSTVDPISHIDFWPPNKVMENAAVPKNENSSLEFYETVQNDTFRLFVFMHFAELQDLKADQYRGFNINLNGGLLYGPLTPGYLSSTTIYTTKALTGKTNYSFSIQRLKNSTLPPILNAVEFYQELDFSQSETNDDDVVSINSIKSTYSVKRNWDGDPCVPPIYLWTGLTCSSEVFDSPRITTLNLSSSGLSGNVSEYFAKLTMLQSLDLSNNDLTGSVPDSLGLLPKLSFLNLNRNKFTGPIPANLIERSKSGSLSLSFEEYGQGSCDSSSCGKKKSSNIVIPIVASVGGLVILVAIVTVVLLIIKKKKNHSVTAVNNMEESIIENEESRSRQFTFSQVKTMTNNFERIIGKGGFGSVYYGFIKETSTPVAVKMLSASSVQGFQEFQTEVKLLMRVHHRNLTCLVGYCSEGTNKALIYEYMANGNLDTQLSGKEINLSWEGRLQIAIDSAQGLEYLHHGCRPPIVHRDVKTTNILLTENFQAKIADFGLSRIFPNDAGTHVSTIVAGTPGYLDPEYYSTNRLNEKSDVYSFGVVILEIITGKPAIICSANERTHIGNWVKASASSGDIQSVVDPKLNGDFDINSVWKAVEISMACISPLASKRPTMNQVVGELNECLVLEQSRRNYSRMTDSTNSIEVFSMSMPTDDHNPLAR